ncbi:hypothetical protein BMETH_15871211407, partial [methanotrophic bacterial endosymbiont of Bathymodiolus sp.]
VSEINYAALNVDFYSHTFTDQDGNPLILEIIDANVNVNAQITGNVLQDINPLSQSNGLSADGVLLEPGV